MYDTGVFKVEAFVGGDYRILSHPSQQALGYQQNIENYVDVATAEGVSLEGHAYCYNYDYGGKPNELFAAQYRPVMEKCPLHGGDQVKKFAEELSDLLSGGRGAAVFDEFITCPVRPTKNLMDCAANMLEGKREFILLEDQLTSANAIFGMVEKVLKHPDRKMALIVRGGPGTGKTVIALHVIAELARNYPDIKAFYTTRSSALRDTLQEKLANVTAGNKGSASGLVRTIFDFRPANFKEGEVDVLLVDEAHRISKSSNFMTDKGDVFTFLPQTLSLLYTAKVCVFFIDDHQGVKPTEIGRSSVLEFSAKNYSKLLAEQVAAYRKSLEKGKEKRLFPLTDIKSSVKDVEVRSIELTTQFRCNGSDNFLDWIDNVIYKTETEVLANGVSFGDEYLFEVDYVGVILGPDITYDPVRQCVAAIPGRTYGVPDSKDFESHIRNIYRVLMSRGRKGCYVYCCNSTLAEYLKRIMPQDNKGTAWGARDFGGAQKIIHEFIEEELKFVDWLPYYDMRAACGYFGDGEPVEESGWVKVSGLGRLNRNMFVVRASGQSMEPMIHDGDLCVFRSNPAGSRQGKILLVQHRSYFDADNAGAYSIKKYSSVKKYDELGNWEHEKVVLIPLNNQYSKIEIDGNDENEFQVIGELLKVLPRERK